MKEQLEKKTIALSDAGCGQDAIEKAVRLLETDRKDDLIRHLRLCRCSLIEDMHKTQRRVDCMDYLIRMAEKSFAAKQ